MKHLFQFSLLLLALLLPATALAHDFEVDGIYYKINGNEATVTCKGSYSSQYDEYTGDVSIPATVTYGGITYSVSSIGNNAFRDCSGLTSITIPNSVTSIGDYAFRDCSGLTSITIPNSVTSIGNSVFDSTPWYDNQPGGLVYAGLVAYKYKGTMPSGTSIALRDGTLVIAGSAFYNCSGLASIVIPNSVTTIGDYAFEYCSGLTSVTIPNSVTSIGYDAFSGCSGLTSITVAGNNPKYDSRDNCNAIIETATNTLVAGCQNTTIPNSVTSIGYSAFYGCTGLTSIDIPNSVTSIGFYAFSGCTGLTSIDIPNSVITIDDYAFDFCTGLTCVTIPNSVTIIGVGTFSYCYGLTSITIPNSVTGIGAYAFRNCISLTSISIPNSVTGIDFMVFMGCTSLTSITVVGNNPMYDSRDNCNAIIMTATNTLVAGCQNTTIPNSVTSIGSYAFYGCSGLTSITIPNSVTSIGNYAFFLCSGLTSITIPNSVTSIGNYAFDGCSNLVEIYSLALIPPAIDSNTFNGCYGATLYVPKNAVNAYRTANYWKKFTNIVGFVECVGVFEVDGILYRAMKDGTATVIANEEMENYYVGNKVIAETVAFEGNNYVVTFIEDNAFNDCYDLTSVVIPNTIDSIGEQAFQGCTGLTSVTIGSGVKTIGSKAFNYCNALATVKCIGTVPPVMASSDCFSTAAYNRATLIVPRQFVDTYQAADYWYKFAHIDGWGTAGMGDVDGDGDVNIKDVTVLIDALLGIVGDSFYYESADLNHNGRIDIGDVTSIVDNLLNGD